MLKRGISKSIGHIDGHCHRKQLNWLVFVLTVLCCALVSHPPALSAKPIRLELASGFHQADPLFGQQISALITKLKSSKIDEVRLRRSRRAMGASTRQMIDLMQVGSIDGALIDPVRLGYRPAIAQLFGGIPFGPTATQIVEWSSSSEGRQQMISDFEAVGVHPLLCGHSDSYSGVFARQAFAWPAQAHQTTVHAKGIGEDIYQSLGFLARQLPVADLYMAYATGVADLLVSLNPAMDARSGFAQVSDYFYYPSWERNSAFALLLIGTDPWQSFSDDARTAIALACEALNSNPRNHNIDATLTQIQQQGSSDTIVQPWPTAFTADAHKQWLASSAVLVSKYPSLAPAFRALKIPGGLTTLPK